MNRRHPIEWYGMGWGGMGWDGMEWGASYGMGCVVWGGVE